MEIRRYMNFNKPFINPINRINSKIQIDRYAMK